MLHISFTICVVHLNTWKDETVKQVEEEELIDADIRQHIKKLKKGKAAGIDGIPNEAWIFMTSRAERQICELVKKVWNGEGIPEDWKEALIMPLYKKGDREQVSNYRGISLLSTGYKIYASTLNEQAGFRKGRSIMDNIYILNHVVEKELSREKGKLVFRGFAGGV